MRFHGWQIFTSVALCFMLVGCGAPNSRKVREEANERVLFVKAQLHFDQANQAFATGQLEKALKEIDVAIFMYEQSANYHVLRGRVFLETHRLEQAMGALDRAKEIDPKHAAAYYFTGIVCQRWSQNENAAEAYLRAWELRTENAQYLLAAAEAMVSLRRYEEAKRLIESRLAYFEHNAAMRQLLAQIALLQGHPRRAAEMFNEARLLNPDDLLLMEELARAEFAAGMYAQCLHTVKQIQARVAEKRTNLLMLEARCLTMVDRTTDARNVYLELTRLAPTNVDVWIELGNLTYSIGDQTRVAQAATQVIALAPERFEGYMLRGLFERHRGRADEAIAMFEKSSSLAGTIAFPHLLLGMMLEQRNDLNGAMLAYGRALRAEPDNIDAQSMLTRLSERASVIASEPTDRR